MSFSFRDSQERVSQVKVENDIKFWTDQSEKFEDLTCFTPLVQSVCFTGADHIDC